MRTSFSTLCSFFITGSVLVATAACSTPDDASSESTSESAQAASQLSSPGLSKTSDLQNGDPLRVLRDEPGRRLALELESLRASPGLLQSNVTLGVYALEAPEEAIASRARERLAALAPELGVAQSKLSGMRVRENTWGIQTDASDWRLTLNRWSGTEYLTNQAKFHKGSGDEVALSEEQLVRRAASHVARTAPAQLADTKSYAYKVRRYMNAVAPASEESLAARAPTVTHYQSAVAFNQTIDDLPIIGPGSKSIVHMTPGGEVVAHEYSMRALGQRLFTLRPNELLGPTEAQKQVEAQLRDRGVALDSYTLERREAGYYRRGRNSIQAVVAPYYWFIYAPTDAESGDKRILEIVPATTSKDVLAVLEADAEADRARKNSYGEDAWQDDQRVAEE